jgi:hypothetical protein
MSINHIFSGGYYESVNPQAWSNIVNGGGGGGSVVSVSGTTDQIAISGTNANPVVGFPNTGINTPALTVNSAYTLPSTIGTPNQVLAIPPSGTVCVWKNDSTGSGTVTNVSNSDNNLTITNGTTTPVINMANNVAINTLGARQLGIISNTFDEALFTFPQVPNTPANNNILVTVNNGTSYATSNFSTINTLLTNTDNNISITNNASNIAQINLASSVNIPTLSVNSAYTMPTNIGSANQVLSVGPTGSTLVWTNGGGTGGGITSISNTDGNLSISNSPPNALINMSSDINIPNLGATTLRINDSNKNTQFNFPILSANPENNSILIAQTGGSSTFQNINALLTNTDGNISITATIDGSANIDLNTNVDIVNLSVNNAYTMPSTIGSTNQVLSVGSTGSTLTWTTPTSSGGVDYIYGTTNQITVSANTGNVTLSLPSLINADSINSLGFTNGNITFPNVLGNQGQILAVDAGIIQFVDPPNIISILGTTNQISVANGTGPSPQIGFPSGENGIVFPNNIITNGSTQGNNSGSVSIGPNALAGINNSFTDSLLVGIGANALSNVVSAAGLNQVVIGNYSATYLNNVSNYNVVYGNQSLADSKNVSPNNNVVVGTYSGQSISNGNNNVIIGNSSMSTSALVAGNGVNNNIVIGDSSLQNVGPTGSRNIVLGNNVNLGVTGSSNNFIVDPTNITNMEIGNIISGTATGLNIPNMKNPFNVNPTLDNQVLSSDVNGNMSWNNIKLSQPVSSGGNSVNAVGTRLVFNTNSFQFFDMTTINYKYSDFYGCATDGRYLYLAPSGYDTIVRYDTYGGFNDPTSYSSVLLAPNLVAVFITGSSAIFANEYIYFIEHVLYESDDAFYISRYNTALPFISSNIENVSVSAFINPQFIAFDGRYIYSAGLDTTTNTTYIFRYDTTLPFISSNVENITISGIAGGFSSINCDGENVYFVSTQAVYTFYIYNIGDPFNAGSINSFNLGLLEPPVTGGLTGSVYDGNYLYFFGTDVVVQYDTNNWWGASASYSVYAIYQTLPNNGFLTAGFDGKYFYYTPNGATYVQTRYNVLNKNPSYVYGYETVDLSFSPAGQTIYTNVCRVGDYVYYIPFAYTQTGGTPSGILARVPAYQGPVIGYY